jgi:hypothetical protein
MKREQIFPLILIFIDICAALGYLPVGDWRRVGYWLCAGALTFFVSF